MIKNTFFSLASNAQERIDALNTIRYTLLLPYNVPKLNKDSNFIDSLMYKCHECCRGLFSNNKQTSYYFFFGRSREVMPFPLYYLNYEPVPVDLDIATKDIGFHTMIMQHCIISTYHAILTELLNEEMVKSYSIANDIKNQGFYTLYKRGDISIQERNIQFNKHIKESSPKSSNASCFNGLTQTHIKVLPKVMDFLTTRSTEDFFNYKLQFASLVNTINNIKVSVFKTLSPKTKKPIHDILDIIEDLTRSMNPFNKNTLNSVDNLYQYYLIERLFNFNLFYGLLKNIKRIEEQTTYRLCDPEILSVLLCCKNLPNVFSRQYFLKYAFDHIYDKPDSFSNFWHTQDLFRANTLMSSTRKTRTYFQFTQWLEQYELFMNYMAKFVIPIYEWCFINMLLTVIEDKYPGEEHFFYLNKAIDFLTDYMNEHCRNILQPIAFSDDMDIMDIITEHKNFEELEDTFKQSRIQIMTALFDSEDPLELNLTPLNPEYFKVNPNAPVSDNNESRIRKFYIDLIRYTYLQS